jgi:chromosome segregation ATPase
MVLRLIDIVDKIQTDRDNELAELKSEVDYLTDHNAELLEEINEPKNKKLQKLNDKIRQLRSWNHRQSLEIQDLRERLQVIDIMFG